MKIFYCGPDHDNAELPVNSILGFPTPTELLAGLNIELPDAIVLKFQFGLERLCSDLLNMCWFLEITDPFRNIFICALLDWPNRHLAWRLVELGIDAEVFAGPAELSAGQIIQAAEHASVPPTTFAEHLCPFIHFEQFNGDEEICLCGADRNRLVINKQRIQRFCGGIGHKNCPFFRNPHTR